MYKVPLNEIKEKIVSSGKMSSEELDAKIKSKVSELSGLISEEGAAHIVANELNIELVSSEQKHLKIKEVYAGMRNISTVGKVVRKFDVNEFAKGDSTGKVCSIILGDETGTIRVVFWNEQVEQLTGVKDGDILALKEVYAKENKNSNNNNKEIHLGDRGEVEINPKDIEISDVRQGTTYERRKIEELQDGDAGVEVLGTVVQIYDPRFFHICPECNKRANETEGKYQCVEHGEVTPALSYVLNLVVDDGTGNIRCVFWKNQINHLLDKTENDMGKFKEDLSPFEEVKTDLLGSLFKLLGRIKRNEMFDRLEFNVQIVEKAKAKEEINKLESVTEKKEVVAGESVADEPVIEETNVTDEPKTEPIN